MNISFLTSPLAAAATAARCPISRPLTAHFPTTGGRTLTRLTHSAGISTRRRNISSTSKMSERFKPARRVAGQKQDVWSIVNEAAAASPVQPIVNMGQGFL